MKQSRKDFIVKAHESACEEWKREIEKEFPKLFKEKLVVGKWYKRGGELVVWNGGKTTYGFVNLGGKYHYSNILLFSIIEGAIPATHKEVETALIEEAEKRGLKPLNHRCLRDGLIWEDNIGGAYQFIDKALGIGASIAFEDGKWATITETITKEQAEKELGKTILN